MLWGPSEGYEWHSKNAIATTFSQKVIVTLWYGYESIRNDLIYWCGTTKKRIPNFLQNTKIVINGSPRGRFEHLGVETA